jgi:hypothetical protein
MANYGPKGLYSGWVADPNDLNPSKEGAIGVDIKQIASSKYGAGMSYEDLSTYSSFSGADILAVAYVPGISDPFTFATLRTVSYSISRVVQPARVVGSTNPVAFSRSARLIAGTLVFTSFDRYIWYEMIGESNMTPGGLVFADMLPPFDITITALNEYSQMSRLAIRGVRIVDEGAVIGVDEMYIEQVHTYMAQDIIPWIPTSARASVEVDLKVSKKGINR